MSEKEGRQWRTREERGLLELVKVMQEKGLAAMVAHLGEAATLCDPDPCAACLLFAVAASIAGNQTEELFQAMKPVIEKLRADNVTRLEGSAK